MMYPPIQSMVERIATSFHPELIILFGSRAAGTADEQSDVDLLVVTDYEDRMERTVAMRRALGDFPVACDLIVKSPEEFAKWRKIVNTIEYIADRHGKVVYER